MGEGKINKATEQEVAEPGKKRSRSFLTVILAVIFTIVLGFLDYFTGAYLSFQVFYLIPIVLITWFANRWMSIFPLIASILSWVYVDIAGSGFYSHPLIPYWNIFVKIVFFLFIIYITSELKQLLDREKLFARIDYLTDIANKRYFYETALKEVNRANRYKRPITMAYLDIDNFKNINDSFGHKAGDEALRITAQVLKKNIRSSDTIARIGGDEFAILFPETDYTGAKTVIQRIQSDFSNIIKHNKWFPTFSIGTITCLDHPCSLDSLIVNADNVMYSAKKNGKNTVRHEISKNLSAT